MADKKERQQYLKFREMANDLRKAEHWDKLDGVLNRNKTVQNLYKMGYRKLSSDVVEVKHGHWIEDIKEICPFNGIVPMKALVGYRCSVCNRPEFLKEPYCNCGAKMDGGAG